MKAVPPLVRRLPGPGPRVVAVPGLGLSVDVPARTLARLSPAAGSLVVALPGYGEPVRPGAALSVTAQADRLLERLGGLGVGPAVLLGHSASCQVVVRAAVRAPDRVTGLVLVGPTTDPRAAGWGGLAGRWLRTAAWERPGQVPTLVRDYTHSGAPGMARAMDAARHDRIVRALATVTGPVLVVRGKHDRIAPAEWTATLAAVAPRGRAVTLP
ncbi:MAG TPA: alpha/beta hydrolase, partial [Pseudonocardia sp.]|nr:alpha/beta hydrolase [Pseudonocardia sp.]